ncbi:MAG: S8 family serine peptidase [Candidatus Eisenbacteria bacterium]
MRRSIVSQPLRTRGRVALRALRALGALFLLAGFSPASAEERVVLFLSPSLSPLGTGDFAGRGPVTGSDEIDALSREHGVVSIDPYYPGALREPRLADIADRLRVLRLRADVADSHALAEAVSAAFERVPGVLAAEIPNPARLFYTPNDPGFPSQWYLPHVDAPLAWDYVRDPDTRGTVVAVIDTGLDFSDPDLAPSVWVNTEEDLDGDGRLTMTDRDGIDQDGNGFIDDVVGWDFGDDDPDPSESTWHGSGVSACVSAATDNGIGIAGIGFGVRVMVLKAFTGGGSLVDGYLPMLYAADNGANVINCSWGIPVFHAYEQAIVDAVWDSGVAIVAAGGDGAQIVYPAAYDHVFAVSATDESDRRTYWAPYGTTIDISAPGANILTIQDGTLHIVSGTSFATGLVSGLAGLVHAAYGAGSTTPTMLLDAITSTAVDIDPLNPGFEGLLGAGRIDAVAAVRSVTGVPWGGAVSNVPMRLECSPNPFSDVTRITWDRAGSVPERLEVYRADGARVAAIGSERLGPGAFEWNATGLSDGVYFVRMRTAAGDYVTTVTLLH